MANFFLKKLVLLLRVLFFFFKDSYAIFCAYRKKDFWQLFLAAQNSSSKKYAESLYYKLLHQFSAWIPLTVSFKSQPCFPHGPYGVFISWQAIIGEGCTIFQGVTVGSNNLEGSKGRGVPKIGDNVLVGAGAKIIGNVTVGNNCRIGANCIVVKDLPDNTTCVAMESRLIYSKAHRKNIFIPL